MSGKRIDRCVICGARGTGYRRVDVPFQETGHTEQYGRVLPVVFSRVYRPGRICYRHNYQASDQQAELFNGEGQA